VTTVAASAARRMKMAQRGVWSYPNGDSGDIGGYTVFAADGPIGHVDRHSASDGDGFLLVDTGPWILGRTVMLPAGIVERIDHAQRTVHVTRSKDDIKHAPEYHDACHDDAAYRDDLAGFYGRFALGL
jgi:hypothetical protein